MPGVGDPSGFVGPAPLDPSQPGGRWWEYRRPDRTTGVATGAEPIGTPEAPQANETEVNRGFEVDTFFLPTGRGPMLLAAGLLVMLVVATRAVGNESLGVMLIPAAGLAAAIGFGQRCARSRPDEPWLPRLLLLGVIAKLVASYVRYLTFSEGYGGIGDASQYDKHGRALVAEWLGGPSAPPTDNLRQTNFVKWLTGIVYYLFGQNLVAVFLLFGLLAVIGSYFWYRGAADALPFLNRRLFLLFMLFAPSLLFWPSSLGKEALMQVGVGAMAWATSLTLRGRLLHAVPLIAGGGWLLWVVRPHLLALVAVAGAVPYFVGRVGREGKGSLSSRPVGMALLGVALVFTVTSGAKYMGLQDLSIDSLEQELNEETERTAQGGSSYEHSGNSLSPLSLPKGAVTVLLRPFPWETTSGFQMLAALEAVGLMVFIARRFGSVALGFRRWRTEPFVLHCLTLLVLYSMTFSSFANFGLLNRQRSLVLPALYVLIALEPALGRARGHDGARAPVGGAPASLGQ
jgi:hypothetical protein